MSSELPPRKVVARPAAPADRRRESDPRPAPAGVHPKTYVYAGLTMFVSQTAALVVAAVVLISGARVAVTWQLNEWREEAKAQQSKAAEDYRAKVEEMRQRFDVKK